MCCALVAAAVPRRTKMPTDRTHASGNRGNDKYAALRSDDDCVGIAHAVSEQVLMPSKPATVARLSGHKERNAGGYDKDRC